jgi:hypothetical protein
LKWLDLIEFNLSSGAAHPYHAEHPIAFKTMKITSVELDRKVTDSKLSVNKHAAQAAANAKAKGWKTWSMLDQCDVLDMATVVSQKTGTTWYFVLRLEEDTEVLWKVQATDHRQVLNKYLQYHSALEPYEPCEY